jgi:hypothetical protein
MRDHGYRRFLPGEEVRLNLEIIKFARMHVREAGVVFRHVEHDKRSELTASGTPEHIEGQSNLVRLTLPIPAGAPPGLYRVNRMWVETYGGRRYDYEGEEVPEHASTLAFEVDEEPDAKPQLSLSYHL